MENTSFVELTTRDDRKVCVNPFQIQYFVENNFEPTCHIGFDGMFLDVKESYTEIEGKIRRAIHGD